MAVLYALLLSLIAASQAQLFPEGQELIYSYHAHIQNSIEEPTLFTSEFYMNANIHIKGLDNGSEICLQDISHYSYMGEGKLMNESSSVPASSNTDCLKLPFFVQYGMDGKVQNVYTDKDDEIWSINMKQAIASLLQLDLLQTDLTKTVPYSFYSDEKSVHGHCQTQYDITPHNKSSSTVKKWVVTCKDRKWATNFNIITPGHCEADFDNSIHQTAYRSYDVEWSKKEFSIKNLESDNTIYFYPINGKGGAHSIHIKQIMHKMQTSPITNKVINIENLVPQGVKNVLYVNSPIHGAYPDMTMQRSKIDIDVVMPKMRDSLRRVVEYLKTTHVTLKEPDWDKAQYLRSLFTELRIFDLPSLEHCLGIISDVKNKDDQGMLDLFYEVLPFVGTESANLFIRDLIKTKRVNDKIAIKMLHTMPFHANFISEILLKELSEFINWGTDINAEVRSAAVLSFSTLVSKVLKTNPENIEVSSYINDFIELFKSTKDYYLQMLYLSALQNLHSTKVAKFLEPLILNSKTKIHKVTPQLRNLAIWAARDSHVKQPEVASNIYWPLLVNDKEILEIRTSALMVLMANPSIHSQMKIYWFMVTQPDKHLYNVYYTALKALASSVSPCYQTSSLNAKRILHYIRMPANSTVDSAIHQYEYYDSAFNMGSVLRVSQIGNIFSHMSTALYMQFSSHVSNLMVNQYSTYLKIQISEKLRDLLKENVDTKSLNVNKISTSIFDAKNKITPDDFHIEHITLNRNHIVSVEYYTDPLKIQEMVMNFLKPTDKNDVTYKIQQMVDGNLLLSTDIGLPFYLFLNMPSVEKLKWSFSDEPSNNIENYKLRIDVMQWNYQQYGITVFDPFEKIWHGTRRLLTMDQYLPISLDISLNIPQKSAKISLNTVPNEDMVVDHFGFQSFVQSQLFQYDMKNYVLSHKTVTKGKEHRKEHIVLDKELEDVGMHLKVAIFDCERSLAPERLIYLQKEFLSNYNKNWGNLPILKMVLALRHWWAYVTLSANSGMCGMGVQVKPSRKTPATHADLSVRFIIDNQDTDNDMIKKSTLNFRTTYNLKNKDEVVKTWDANIISDLTGSRINEAVINITRMKPGLSDYKVCISGKQTWKDESVSSVWTVLAGETSDNKCPMDKMHLDVVTKNEHSAEQKHHKLIDYPQCNPKTYEPLMCTMAHSSLRHYEYDVNYVNAPQELVHTWISFKDWLRKEYSHHFVRVFDEDKITKKGNVKMVLDYPINTDDLNVAIYTPNGCHSYEGIPLANWYWTGLAHPYSPFIPVNSHVQKDLGLAYTCEITPISLVNQFQNYVEYETPHEWTLYASDMGTNPKWKIYVKKVDEDKPLALRIMALNDKLEVHNDGDFQLKLNDKSLPVIKYGYRSESWFDYKVIRQEHKMTIIVREVGISLDYGGKKVDLHLTRGLTYEGLCFEIPQMKSLDNLSV